MNAHATAVATLTSWSPPDDAQAVLRTAYLDCLADHANARPNALSRDCRPAHLTASAIVVDPAADHTLLVLHAKLGLWVQPGGHCEPADASLRAAAEREVREETGLRELAFGLAPVRLSRHGAPCGADEHFDVQYVAVAPKNAKLSVSAESRDVRWFGVDELPDALAADVSAGVAAVRASVLRTEPSAIRSSTRR